MTSRWKLDRKKLKKAKGSFAQKTKKLGLRNTNGTRPEVISSPPNRHYRDWNKWMDRKGILPPRHRPWGADSIEEREGYYSDSWLSPSGRAVYVTSNVDDF